MNRRIDIDHIAASAAVLVRSLPVNVVRVVVGVVTHTPSRV